MAPQMAADFGLRTLPSSWCSTVRFASSIAATIAYVYRALAAGVRARVRGVPRFHELIRRYWEASQSYQHALVERSRLDREAQTLAERYWELRHDALVDLQVRPAQTCSPLSVFTLGTGQRATAVGLTHRTPTLTRCTRRTRSGVQVWQQSPLHAPIRGSRQERRGRPAARPGFASMSAPRAPRGAAARDIGALPGRRTPPACSHGMAAPLCGRRPIGTRARSSCGCSTRWRHLVWKPRCTSTARWPVRRPTRPGGAFATVGDSRASVVLWMAREGTAIPAVHDMLVGQVSVQESSAPPTNPGVGSEQLAQFRLMLDVLFTFERKATGEGLDVDAAQASSVRRRTLPTIGA